MDSRSRIFVAGHRGLLGSALLRRLEAAGYREVLVRTRQELDLTRRGPVEEFFLRERPEYVFLAAARVGGIEANRTRPADFILENLLIQTSVLEAARLSGVRRLIFFGSTCLYPRECPQPMPESQIGSGRMEPTSEAYSTAKLAGFTMCESYNRQHGTQFLTVVPATLYGPGDNFNPADSHVLSALLRRFHEAKASGAPEVVVWGTGKPVREFLYVDDAADACLHLMACAAPPPTPVNVGTGRGTSIAELAEEIRSVVGYRGRVVFDASRPDGAPAKVLDSGRLAALGWAAHVPLKEGLERTYAWYLRLPRT